MDDWTVQACIKYIDEIRAMPGYENFAEPKPDDFIIDAVRSVRNPETLK